MEVFSTRNSVSARVVVLHKVSGPDTHVHSCKTSCSIAVLCFNACQCIHPERNIGVNRIDSRLCGGGFVTGSLRYENSVDSDLDALGIYRFSVQIPFRGGQCRHPVITSVETEEGIPFILLQLRRQRLH